MSAKTIWFYGLVLLFALFLFIGGCGQGTVVDEPADEGDAVGGEVEDVEKAPLVAGANIGYPPFEYYEGDVAVGFDIDLWEEIGKRTGRETSFMNIPWDGLIAGLQAEKFDVIMSCMGITEERLKQIDFSEPYYLSRFAIAVQNGSDIKSLADLEGKIVGVQTGTMAENWIREHAEELGIASIVPYDEMPDCILDLQAGRIDGAANDFPYLAHLQSGNPDIEIVDETFGDGIKIGIAFRKGTEELRAEIDAAIDEIIGDGTYAKIYEKWFGKKPSPDEMPR
jgi:polar amino acid transport system substrate-binding protein